MQEKNQGSQDSLFTSVENRLSQLQRALGHVAQAVHLEMAMVEIEDRQLTDTEKERYQEIGQRLLSMASFNEQLAKSLGLNVTIDSLPSTTNILIEVPKFQNPSVRVEEPVPSIPNKLEEPVQPKVAEVEDEKEEPVTKAPTNSVNHNVSRLHRVQATPQSNDRPKSNRVESKENEDNKLYKEIVSARSTPAMELREGMTPIDVTIEDDTTVLVNGKQIELKGDELFMFNSLFLLRDKPRASKELRELGFRPDAKPSTINSHFYAAMTSLTSHLNVAARVEIIKKIGSKRTTQYCINPAAILIDQRVSSDGQVPEIVKKN